MSPTTSISTFPFFNINFASTSPYYRVCYTNTLYKLSRVEKLCVIYNIKYLIFSYQCTYSSCPEEKSTEKWGYLGISFLF